MDRDQNNPGPGCLSLPRSCSVSRHAMLRGGLWLSQRANNITQWINRYPAGKKLHSNKYMYILACWIATYPLDKVIFMF